MHSQSLQRYAPIQLLGEGASGQVWLACDQVTHEHVALKRISAWTEQERARARREGLALRTLRIPGVVALRDEGEDDLGPFLVLDYVEGVPFPGLPQPAPWGEVAPRLVRLLETLAAVHATGVVHRDIKPANVLVTAEGQPILVDFGLARGPTLGETLTQSHQLLGTPRYLAPEALFNARVDARADLYAVGVMVWEALTGRSLFPEDAPIKVKLARPPPLREVVSDLDPGHASLIDDLVAPEPDDRPLTASHALRRLRNVGPRSTLPLVGRQEALAQTLGLLGSRRQVRILATPGSGATRFLDALTSALSPTLTLRPLPATKPFASLTGFLGPPTAGLNLADTRQELTERLGCLDGIVLVDRTTQPLDRWSHEVLASAPNVVRIVEQAPADVVLDPLSADQLQILFVGPERLLRLRSRAAHLLWVRTQGLSALVAEELQAWVRAGHAQWAGERVRLAPASLDTIASALIPVSRLDPRTSLDPELDTLLALIWLAQPAATDERLRQVTGLSTWEAEALLEDLRSLGLAAPTHDGWVPRAPSLALQRWDADEQARYHHALARTFAEGSVERCRHLTLAGKPAEAALEAQVLAQWARAAGEAPQALRVLSALAPSVTDPRDRERVLTAWADLALEQRTPDELDKALRALSPHSATPPLGAWWALLSAWQLVDLGHRDRARAQSEAIRARSDLPEDVSFVRWLATLEMETSKDEPLLAREVLERYAGFEPLGAQVEHWRGLLTYRAGHYRQAAELHERGLALASGPLSRCSALFNAAAAWLAVPELERAAARATELRELSRSTALYRFEARAEWVLRSVAYRRNEALVPDLELVDAAELLGLPVIAGLITLNEAAIAWRTGNPDALSLAERAAAASKAAGQQAAALLSRALAVALNEDIAPAEACLHEALRCPLPAIALQVLGLVGPLAGSPPHEELGALIARFAPDERSARREVLSLQEALDRLTR